MFHSEGVQFLTRRMADNSVDCSSETTDQILSDAGSSRIAGIRSVPCSPRPKRFESIGSLNSAQEFAKQIQKLEEERQKLLSGK